MAYKNDDLTVIANKYGKASGDGKAELYETYDRIRDLTAAGTTIGGSGLGSVGSWLMNLAQLIAPSSFIPVLGNSSINVPGTSFFGPMVGGAAVLPGGQAAFGLSDLARYPHFPNVSGKAAPINLGLGIGSALLGSVMGIGSSSGVGSYAIGGGPTGGAASAIAGMAAGNVTGSAAGAGFGRGLVMPLAGIISGIGGIATTLGPLFGPYGIAATAAGSIASGFGGAVLNAYQSVSNRILNNADTILTNKVRNLETTIKQLDTQSGIIRKMIKEGVEGDGKALQETL